MWIYITEQGDTWDVLALDLYGSEKLAHILQQANPIHMHLIYFPAGIELMVPPTPKTKNLLPKTPWEKK